MSCSDVVMSVCVAFSANVSSDGYKTAPRKQQLHFHFFINNSDKFNFFLINVISFLNGTLDLIMFGWLVDLCLFIKTLIYFDVKFKKSY